MFTNFYFHNYVKGFIIATVKFIHFKATRENTTAEESLPQLLKREYAIVSSD